MQICYQLILLFANLCANLCANHLNPTYSLLCAKRHLKQVQLQTQCQSDGFMQIFWQFVAPNLLAPLSHSGVEDSSHFDRLEIVHILTKCRLTVRRFELDVKVRG